MTYRQTKKRACKNPPQSPLKCSPSAPEVSFIPPSQTSSPCLWRPEHGGCSYAWFSGMSASGECSLSNSAYPTAKETNTQSPNFQRLGQRIPCDSSTKGNSPWEWRHRCNRNPMRIRSFLMNVYQSPLQSRGPVYFHVSR